MPFVLVLLGDTLSDEILSLFGAGNVVDVAGFVHYETSYRMAQFATNTAKASQYGIYPLLMQLT